MTLWIRSLSLVVMAIAGPWLSAQDKGKPDLPEARESGARSARAVAMLSALPDTLAASSAIAGIAAEVCKCDQVAAVRLFEQAVALLTKKPLREETASPARQLTARKNVEVQLARCDPALLTQLLPAIPAAEEGFAGAPMSLVSAGRELLDSDARKSAEVAGRAVSSVGQMSDPQLLNFVDYLLNLRERSPAEADHLFLRALSSIPAGSPGRTRALFALGNYLFGPPGSPLHDGVGTAPLKDGQMAYVLAVKRPAASEAALEGYVGVAGALLSTAGSGSENVLRVALLDQLGGHLPEGGNVGFADLQAIRRAAGAGLKGSAFTEAELRQRMVWRPESYFSSLEDELRNTANPNRRDEIILTLCERYFSTNEFHRAFPLAPGLSDPAARAPLREALLIGQASQSLAAGREELALQLVAHLPSAALRGLILLGAAARRAKQKEENDAMRYLDAALTDLRQAPPSLRPELLIAATALCHGLSAERSATLLAAAVDELNRRPPKAKPKTLSQIEVELVATKRGLVQVFALPGSSPRYFVFAIPLVQTFDLRGLVTGLRGLDPERVLAILGRLRADSDLCEAMLAFATAFSSCSKSGAER
jgi:hypothetical protein